MQTSTAFAHSEFVSSNPSNGSVLAESPISIEVNFSDKVTLSFDSLELLDSNSKKIDIKKPKVINAGLTISAEIPTLKDGSYIAVYTIVSADSHVIKGAFSFSVGEGVGAQSQGQSEDQIAKLLADKKTSTVLRQSTLISQLLVFTSLAIIIGAIAFRLLIVERSFSKKQNRIFYLACILCILATFLNIGFQAAAQGSFSILKAFSYDVLSQEFQTYFGKIYLLRIVICILAIILWKFSKSNFVRIALVAAAWVLSLTPALTGHANSGEYQQFSFILDVTHVIAASIWFGGLLLLPFFLKEKDYKDIVSKFSSIAFYCVIVILGSGAFAFWRQTKSVEAGLHTFFGNLVILKIVLFLLLIVVAYFSRSFVKRLISNGSNESSDFTTKKKLTKLIYLESAVLIVVMILSSVLVNSVPAKIAIDAGISRQVVTKKSIIEVDVDRTKFGLNTLHIYLLDKNGTPKQVGVGINALQEEIINATWSNEEKNIESLPIQMRFLGLNHFISTDSNIPSPGTWTLTVKIKVDEFNSETMTTKIKFR